MKPSELKQLALTMPITDHVPTRDEYVSYLLGCKVSTSCLYQELEMERECAQFQRDIVAKDSTARSLYQLHSHTFFEVVYCREAGGAEYLVGSRRYSLETGDIIIIPPGVSHRPLLPEHLTGDYSRDVMWVSQSFAHRIVPALPDGSPEGQPPPPLLRTQGTPWADIGSAFDWGVRESELCPPGQDASVVGCALIIMGLIRRMCCDSRTYPPAAERYTLSEQILLYIEEHLSERITLSRVASYFYVSESTIAQNFKKSIGVSFYRCLTQRRLIAAKALIEQGAPLSAISAQVGFTDYSCFYRVFKREYGISPREYRKLFDPSAKEPSPPEE